MSSEPMERAQIRQGRLRGRKGPFGTLFAGIPYAAPPVGKRRFAPPAPPLPWEGERDASRFGSRCPQMDPNDFDRKEFYSDPAYETAESEDALVLNVWTPAARPGEDLPVALWIHGGAFFNGYGHETEFDGQAYCRRGVVLVTCNYRLGALGFLVHPWLIEEQGGSAGNYGLRDQLAALDWVRGNIRAFGGNPDHITVMGQSAGAMSVQTLVLMAQTQGKIAGAVMQSGGGVQNGLMVDRTQEQACRTGEAFVKQCGAGSLDALRELPVFVMRSASRAVLLQEMGAGNGLAFLPVIDHRLLPDTYEALTQAGRFCRVPYLIGSNAQDLTIGESADENLCTAGIRWALLTERFGCPSYVYRCAHPAPGDGAGAFHSAELWYMFGTLDRCWRPFTAQDSALSAQMLDCWTNFIRTGAPGRKNDATWPPYTEKTPDCMQFA